MRLALGTRILAASLICLAAHSPTSAALVQCRSEAGASVYAFESGPLRLDLCTRARRLTLDLPVEAAGLLPGTKLLLRALGPDGLVNETTITDSSVDLQLMPDSALFLVVSRK